MLKKTLLIIGASGHGKVAADIAMNMKIWREILFLDDDKSKKECMGFKVIGGGEEAFLHSGNIDYFVAIGDNSTRKVIQERLVSEGKSVVKLIHPSAIIASNVEIGNGSIVMAGVVINSSTVIGAGCIVNTGSSLDHDNMLGDYVHVSPGVKVAGGVYVGEKTWLGIGSIVSNNISIYKNSIIGAGAVVLKDITESGTYVGSPIKN